MSEVHCTRAQSASIDAASARASAVLPDARVVLDQHVPARQQRDQHRPHRVGRDTHRARHVGRHPLSQCGDVSRPELADHIHAKEIVTPLACPYARARSGAPA